MEILLFSLLMPSHLLEYVLTCLLLHSFHIQVLVPVSLTHSLQVVSCKLQHAMFLSVAIFLVIVITDIRMHICGSTSCIGCNEVKYKLLRAILRHYITEC